MVQTSITREKISGHLNDDTHVDDGAELVFNGRVRNSEKGDPIIGIEYECYDGMAQKELQKLAEETAEKFHIRDLDCIHRIGYVPIGEASLRVVIWSKHRVEGLEAMAWFISEMKERVPIWKHIVLPNGIKLAQ